MVWNSLKPLYWPQASKGEEPGQLGCIVLNFGIQLHCCPLCLSRFFGNQTESAYTSPSCLSHVHIHLQITAVTWTRAAEGADGAENVVCCRKRERLQPLGGGGGQTVSSSWPRPARPDLAIKVDLHPTPSVWLSDHKGGKWSDSFKVLFFSNIY